MIDVLILAIAVYVGGSGIVIYRVWLRRERLRLAQAKLELERARREALEEEISNLRGGQ